MREARAGPPAWRIALFVAGAALLVAVIVFGTWMVQEIKKPVSSESEAKAEAQPGNCPEVIAALRAARANRTPVSQSIRDQLQTCVGGSK